MVGSWLCFVVCFAVSHIILLPGHNGKGHLVRSYVNAPSATQLNCVKMSLTWYLSSPQPPSSHRYPRLLLAPQLLRAKPICSCTFIGTTRSRNLAMGQSRDVSRIFLTLARLNSNSICSGRSLFNVYK